MAETMDRLLDRYLAAERTLVEMAETPGLGEDSPEVKAAASSLVTLKGQAVEALERTGPLKHRGYRWRAERGIACRYPDFPANLAANVFVPKGEG